MPFEKASISTLSGIVDDPAFVSPKQKFSNFLKYHKVLGKFWLRDALCGLKGILKGAK